MKMKKIALVVLIFMAMVLGRINVYSQTNPNRDSQWDFFANVIPKHNSITISGSTPSSSIAGNLRDTNLNWKITIDDKYNASFSGDIQGSRCGHRDDYRWNASNNNAIIIDRNSHAVAGTNKGKYGVSVTYRGSGSLVWDDDKMKIMLTVNASGQCSGDFFYEVFEGRGNSNRRSTSLDSDNIYSSGNSTFSLAFALQSDYNPSNSTGQIKLLLSQNTLTLSMSGDFAMDLFGTSVYINYPCKITSTVGGNNWYTASAVQKSQSELNAISSDQFGDWTWNEDRTLLFLKSKTSENRFAISKNNGNFSWFMEMAKGTTGTSESKTEKGDKIVNLSMSFDGEPAQLLSFIENKENPNQNIFQLDYVVYNRFLGTMDKNANEILNLIKDRQILILSYAVNGVQKTDMFMLRGLKTIFENM
jgi:hypothetical protein